VACIPFVLAGAFLQQPWSPQVEPASNEAQQALAGFRPEPGIALELFAAEPLLANPVAFHVDARGDVYVAETFRILSGVTDIRRHMDWLDDDLAARTVEERMAFTRKHVGAAFESEYGTASERVRRLRDTDGDGQADQSTVFAQGFAHPAAGIGAGVLSYRGDVFYTCIPDLWLLRDRDGDGEAEERRALSSGYGVHVALYGHDLHGLSIGPDRRLYFSIGDRGFHVQTPAGTLAHPDSGAVLRCELDGSGLEVWHSGLRNPQELAFDELGNLFTGDNNSDGGDQARWVNVVEGGDSGWRYPYQWITEPVARGPWNDERLWVPHFDGQAAYIVPPIANLANGPSGLTCYPGTGLAPGYAGHFFLCDFRGTPADSGVHTFTVLPRGASWELGPVRPFVWGLLATDCDFGPEGALWISDWVRGWEQTGKGRLYRAFDPQQRGSALVSETRALLERGTPGLPEDELVELLGHPDRRVRQEAHFALAERGTPGRIASVALDEAKPFLARLHALWALWVAARADAGLAGPLRALAQARDPELRAQALRALGDVRDREAGPEILAGLGAPEPRVRFFAALAAGRTGLSLAVEPLARLLREVGESDTNLRHALVMGLAGAAGPEDLPRLAADESAHVRLGVLLVLRRRADPAIARFLLDGDPRLVLEAARAIHDLPIPGALESLALARVDEARRAAGERALVRRVLNANYRLGKASVLAGYSVRTDLPAEYRVEALEMLAHWAEPPARDRVTNAWRPLEPRPIEPLAELAVRLSSGPILAAEPAVLAAYVRFVGAAGARELAPLLAGWVADPPRAAEVKIAALAALETLAAEELAPAVRAALADVDGSVRAAALERLERLDPALARSSLPALVEGGELAERRAAYRILARQRDPEALELLRRESVRLAADLVPAELALDLVLACEAQGDAGLAAELARIAARRAADPALAPYLDGLFGGDAQRGQHVFERVDLSCTRCHAWWQGADPQVGPNLWQVGQRLTRLQLLESILVPNRRTTPGFGATALFLLDGRIVNGRVLEETPESVRLLTSESKVVSVPKGEIEEQRPDLSAMPEDLVRSLSREELRDLLEYLARL
jgi:quinoprotein glucose dehydrogenase